MTSVTVLVPVLARPHRVAPLLASLKASATPAVGPELSALFLCSPGDDLEIAAVKRAGQEPMVVPWQAGHADWSRKLDFALDFVRSEWVLFGADDLHFHPGWATEALAVAYATRACVVGTNDVGNRRVMAGRHSTHPLVHIAYRECGLIDRPGSILNADYGHCFADDELVQTAMYRQTWAFAKDAVVAHLHPDWGKGQQDATYEKGQSTFQEDRALYERRKALWGQ